VFEWRKHQQTRAAVRLVIEEALEELPASYGKVDYEARCDALYLHVFESYFGSGLSVHARQLQRESVRKQATIPLMR